MVAEHGIHGHDFRVHVAHPDKPVAFDPVPQIVLHVEVDRIRGGLPDAVQPVVIAAERAEVRDVTVPGNRTDGDNRDFYILVQQIDAGEPETTVPEFRAAQPGNGDLKVPDRMVVGGRTPRRIDIAQGL